ncbi:MAG TPA: amidase domain-containing protein, partial [Candidatus Lokiarchaeia archaeon]|nr:amidase domain-containing protein [Candidatus Lokiarchaeia archaeon]
MANRRNMLYSVCLIVLVAISAFYQLPAGLINQSAHSPAKQLIDPPLSVPPRSSVVANPPEYLRQAAYGYALEWYNTRNNHYNDYTASGGDCANFVSQCLIAGGISLYNGTDGTGYGVYPDKDRPTGHSNGTMPYCDYLDLNLRNFQNTHVTGPLTSPTLPDEMCVGDVVIFGNSTGDNYEHATIVVWDGGSQLGLAAHTTDVWNQSFSSYMSEFSCATFYHFVDSTANYFRFEVNASIGSLNVRVGPGKNGMPTPQYYDAIGQIYPGQEYIAFGSTLWQGKRWWHFWFDDRAAWCAQQGDTYNYTIDVTGDGNLQPVEVVVNTALNVRDGPGTSYAIFGQVYNGMRFVSNSSSG